MSVLVSDTSVLIDLERGTLLEAALRLPFVVPDLLFAQELADPDGERLTKVGLRVEGLTGSEVLLAVRYRRLRPKLCRLDTFALALARSRGWVLLTGNGDLRALAAEEEVTCHGVLWLLEQLLEAAATSPQALHDGLQSMAAHPRSRLPRREIRLLFDRLTQLLDHPP